VVHLKDYPTATLAPWEFPHRQEMPEKFIKENPLITRAAGFDESTQHFFIKDKDHPYEQEKPFDWIRGYQVGGKSIMWARQTQRWSDYDFEGPLRDGFSVDWPIRYADIAPWYDYVETFAGISGKNEGLSQLPDGQFLPPMDMNVLEEHFKSEVKSKFDGRCVTIGRTANRLHTAVTISSKDTLGVWGFSTAWRTSRANSTVIGRWAREACAPSRVPA